MTSHKGSSNSRRTVLKTMGGLTMAGALAGCTSSFGSTESSSQEPEYEATMGIVATELSQIPSITAMREMLPATSDQRLTGSVRTFSGSRLAMQAMVSGSIDYYALSPGNVFQAQIAGNDLRVLATKVKGTDYVFAVQPEIDSLEQIVNQGKSVGIAGLGGASHMQVAGVFLKEGYDPQNDVNLQQLGGSSTRTAAVASGKIDATVIHIDQFKQIKDEGFEGKTLFELREYFPNFITHTVTVPASHLESDPERAHVESYMNQFVKANKRATEDFEWLYKKTEKFQAEPLPEEEAKESWELNANVLKAWPHQESDYQKEDYRNQIDVLVAAGVLKKSDAEKINLDKLLDMEHYRNSIENL